MKETIKRILRQLLIKLGIPATKNIRYDIYTERIFKTVLKPDSNCVDIGAHKGEILELFLKLAPHGVHAAFEPIPAMYKNLLAHFGQRVKIFPFALSSETGETQFNVVLDDPAYSGIKQREYKKADVKIEKIKVDMRKLDDVLMERSFKIDLIKIDVEGGEFDVLKGSAHILQNDKPILVFECGRGASEFYGTKPEELYNFLHKLHYSIRSLGSFVKDQKPMSQVDFVKSFQDRTDYYFVAN